MNQAKRMWRVLVLENGVIISNLLNWQYNVNFIICVDFIYSYNDIAMHYSNNNNIVAMLVIIANTMLVHMYTHMWLAALHTLGIVMQNFIATTDKQDCSV